MESTSIRFAGAARELSRAARLCGIDAPAFTSPPRLTGYSRTIRRRPNGVTVSIALRNRPWPAVLADMVDGVINANGLTGREADQARNALWLSVVQPDAEIQISAAA